MYYLSYVNIFPYFLLFLAMNNKHSHKHVSFSFLLLNLYFYAGAPLEGIRNVGYKLSAQRPSSSVAMAATERLATSGGVNKGTSEAVKALRTAYLANHQKGYKRESKSAGGMKSKGANWSFPAELDTKLRKLMSTKWKLISNALRGQDTRRKKALHGGVFRRTVSRFGVNLNESDMKHLRHKFGVSSHRSSKKQLSIDYVSFLNHYAAGSATLTARSRRLRPQSATITRARLTEARNYRGTGGSTSLRKSASYQPSARQMEASLTAHVRKALQIANAPADRRALKAALATARSTSGSLTQRSINSNSFASAQRSRALSRGMPGKFARPSSAPRTFRRSASASSIQQRNNSTRRNEKNRIATVGPAITTTSRRDLGDSHNPTGGAKARGSYRGSSISQNGLLGHSNLMMSRTINLRNRTLNSSSSSTALSTGRSIQSTAASLFTTNTPVPSASEIQAVCAKLKPLLKPCWKQVRKELKNEDTSKRGSISARLFRSILARYDISVNEADFYTIVNKFGREQEVKYDPFIRMCLR